MGSGLWLPIVIVFCMWGVVALQAVLVGWWSGVRGLMIGWRFFFGAWLIVVAVLGGGASLGLVVNGFDVERTLAGAAVFLIAAVAMYVTMTAVMVLAVHTAVTRLITQGRADDAAIAPARESLLRYRRVHRLLAAAQSPEVRAWFRSLGG